MPPRFARWQIIFRNFVDVCRQVFFSWEPFGNLYICYSFLDFFLLTLLWLLYIKGYCCVIGEWTFLLFHYCFLLSIVLLWFKVFLHHAFSEVFFSCFLPHFHWYLPHFRTRVLERDRMELGLFALPHWQRNSIQDQRSYARTFCHPVSGRSITPPLHTMTHQDFNIGDSFARASRLEQGALRAPHTGRLRLDELDEASRRTLEGLRNGFNMDFNHLIICTHCDLMI